MTARRNTRLAIRRRANLSQRLDLEVAVGAPDECWPWMGPRNRWGYGRQKLHGREVMMHRVAYERAHGPIPDGLVVRHTCDNPPCCNPAHLIVGTHADNHADCVERMRHPFGERVYCAKLTAGAVRIARRKYAAGDSVRDLADKYGVSEATMRRAIQRITWKSVDADTEPLHLTP